MDNGLASFDRVMIPRRNMAMRFAHVDENGKYSKKQVSPAASKTFLYNNDAGTCSEGALESKVVRSGSTLITFRFIAIHRCEEELFTKVANT